MSRTAKRVATAPIVEVAERPWKGNGVLVWSEKSRAFRAGSVVFQDKYTKNFSAPSKTYRKQHNPKGATWENPVPASLYLLFSLVPNLVSLHGHFFRQTGRLPIELVCLCGPIWKRLRCSMKRAANISTKPSRQRKKCRKFSFVDNEETNLLRQRKQELYYQQNLANKLKDTLIMRFFEKVLEHSTCVLLSNLGGLRVFSNAALRCRSEATSSWKKPFKRHQMGQGLAPSTLFFLTVTSSVKYFFLSSIKFRKIFGKTPSLCCESRREP